jgi:DNA-binding beta-propeller fold protein YncE
MEVIAVLGGLGDTPGRFTYPRAIEADEASRTLWVIDKSARVQQIDAETGVCLALWHMPEYQSGKPVGVTLGPPMPDSGSAAKGERLLYVPDTHYHRVMVYRPREVPGPRERAKMPAPTSLTRDETAPGLVASWGEYGTGPGQFIYPTDVAILPAADGSAAERIYVSEYGGNDRISVFDGQRRFLFSFGSFGPDASAEHVQFDRPQSMCFLESGGAKRLVVTDSRNHRIGVFTPEGKLVRWLGSPEEASSAPGRFRIPYGLYPVGDGTVLVAEFGNNRVQRIDVESGECLGVWGMAGREIGELANPWSVVLMGGRMYVLDTWNDRIQVVRAPSRR